MLKRDDAIKTVVKFTTKVDEKKENVGTGFFIHRDDVLDKLYIITASHVAKGFNNTTIVSMIDKIGGFIVIPLVDLQRGKCIKYHSTADVCAIEVDVSVFNTLDSGVMLFGTSLIDSKKITNLSRDVELTSIGFPMGLGIGNRFEPLSFRSHPSSNLISNVSGLQGGYVSDVFILENPACGGYSGCPVIDLGYIVTAVLTQSSQTFFYGLIHGTISDSTGGKMAVVTPAYYILQII